MGEVTDRAVWRLLVKGIGTFLPAWEPPAEVSEAARVGLPVFLSAESGFGLHLRGRGTGAAAPEREIYSRGQSIGIVVVGSVAAVGSRVVDAPRLLRYGRRLTFETIFNAAEAESVAPAVRASRAVESVIVLDPVVGVGLCAELDPVTGQAGCPLYVRFASGRSVHAYVAGGLPAQPVRSQT